VTSFDAFSRTGNISHIHAVSEAALVHLTKVLATNFASQGFQSNSIPPGLLITETTKALIDMLTCIYFAKGAKLIAKGSDLIQSVTMSRGAVPAKRTDNSTVEIKIPAFLFRKAKG